jgi:hypothetical protein
MDFSLTVNSAQGMDSYSSDDEVSDTPMEPVPLEEEEVKREEVIRVRILFSKELFTTVEDYIINALVARGMCTLTAAAKLRKDLLQTEEKGLSVPELIGAFMMNPTIIHTIQSECGVGGSAVDISHRQQSSSLATTIALLILYMGRQAVRFLDLDPTVVLPWDGFLHDIGTGFSHINESGGEIKLSAFDLHLFEAFCIITVRFPHAPYPRTLMEFAQNNMFPRDSSSFLHFLTHLKRALLPHVPDTFVTVWSDALKYPEGVAKKVADHKAEELLKRLESPINVELAQIHHAIAEVTSPTRISIPDRIVLLMLHTGCRMSEALLPTVKMEPLPAGLRAEPDRYILQIGRAKAKCPEDHTARRIVPIFGDQTSAALLAIREALVEDFIEKVGFKRGVQSHVVEKLDQRILAQEINNSYQKTVNRRVRELFPEQAQHCEKHGLPFGSHFLRSLWVNALYEEERNHSPSKTLFMTRLLGHGEAMSSAKHYERVNIITPFELQARAKKTVKRKAPATENKEGEDGEKAKKKRAPPKKKNPAAAEPEPTPQPSIPSDTITPVRVAFPGIHQKRVIVSMAYDPKVVNTIGHACNVITTLMENGVAPLQEHILQFEYDTDDASAGTRGLLQRHFHSECIRLNNADWGEVEF